MAQGNATPVRIYADDDARLPRLLGKVLQDRIEGLSEAVLNGQLNERDYSFYTGQIAGLRLALSECEIISKGLSGN